MVEHTQHVAPVRLYVVVFLSLLVLTFLTVGVTYVDMGEYNLFVALGIAIFKASLVILYFMHARWSPRLVQIVMLTSLLFIGILASFSFADYLTRGLLGVPGR